MKDKLETDRNTCHLENLVTTPNKNPSTSKQGQVGELTQSPKLPGFYWENRLMSHENSEADDSHPPQAFCF